VESVIDRISVADLASRQNALDDLLPGSRQKVRPAVRVKKKK